MVRSVDKEGASAMALLEALMEGLTDEISGATRSLAARLTSQFLECSLSQVHTSPQAQFVDAHALLRRLLDRLTHPSPYHRLGATLALTQCARVIASQDAFLDQYFMTALQHGVTALRLAEREANA